MKNLIALRPHHFLCLPGYKGYGYNKAHQNSWNKMSNVLKNKHDVNVVIVDGEDTLCKQCPNKGENCREYFVKKIDNAVKNLLGLKTNNVYKYEDVLKKLKNILNPKKHEDICGECSWRNGGLCKDTFKKSKENVTK